MNRSGLRPLAIVVVNYRSHGLLETNLVPVAQSDPSVVVVVVDNFSDDEERGAVSKTCERFGWHLRTPERNLGFGAGMNLGVATAMDQGAEAFLLLNPDATIDPASLDRLRRELQEDPGTLLAPIILRPDGSTWFGGAVLDLDRGETLSDNRAAARGEGRYSSWLTGACLLIGNDVWRRLKGFDERYFLYWEDVDLSFRASAAGFGLGVITDATAVHAEGGTHSDVSVASSAKSAVYYYYNIRNRLLFASLNLDEADRRRWRRRGLPAAYEVLLRGGRRQFLHSARPWTAALRGTIDGLRLAR